MARHVRHFTSRPQLPILSRLFPTELWLWPLFLLLFVFLLLTNSTGLNLMDIFESLFNSDSCPDDTIKRGARTLLIMMNLNGQWTLRRWRTLIQTTDHGHITRPFHSISNSTQNQSQKLFVPFSCYVVEWMDPCGWLKRDGPAPPNVVRYVNKWAERSFQTIPPTQTHCHHRSSKLNCFQAEWNPQYQTFYKALWNNMDWNGTVFPSKMLGTKFQTFLQHVSFPFLVNWKPFHAFPSVSFPFLS